MNGRKWWKLQNKKSWEKIDRQVIITTPLDGLNGDRWLVAFLGGRNQYDSVKVLSAAEMKERFTAERDSDGNQVVASPGSAATLEAERVVSRHFGR